MVIVLDNFLQNSILPTPPPEIYISKLWLAGSYFVPASATSVYIFLAPASDMGLFGN